jgi:hypothetical protein
VRLAAGDLIPDNPAAIDVERRRRIVEPHHLLRLGRIDARYGKRELRLAQIALQALAVLVDADQQERDTRVVLIFRVGRFEVR